MRINKHDTQGTKPLLGKGELGYDDYAAGGDVGRVYVGTGSENIALAEKSEVDSHVNRVDNPHNVTKAQVGLGNVDNTADVNKNVLSATKWTTARTITLSGDVAGSASMDGTANVSITTTVQPNSVALGTDTTGNYVAGITQGTGITVSGTAGEGWSPTVAITNVGTAGTYTKVTTNAQGQVTSGTTLAATDIPALDASKITTGIIDAARLPAFVDDVLEFADQASFPATGESGKIYVALDTNKTYRWSGSVYVYITSGAVDSVNGQTGVVNITTVTGNAGTATKLQTTRNIALIGDVTGNVNFDGSADVSISATIAANSVALGTDTTGDYVAGVTQGTGISVTGTAGEGWSPTIAITNVGTAGTYTKVTTNAQGQVTSGTTLSATDIPSLDASKITTGTLPVVQGGTGVTTSTGTGSVVLSTSPTLTTPNIGVATGTSFNSITGLASVAPLVAGTADVGTSTLTARQDHVHPAQTSVTGNAGTATTLQTARTIGASGDVTGTATSFNGSANITIPMTLANSGVTAGTYSKVTVDAKGRVTAGLTPTMEDIPDATFKRSVRCATTANITLSGTQTIDGIAVVAGDRVLVKNQTTTSQNGIYVVAASTWTRALDANSSSKIASAIVAVDSGTVNGGKLFDNDFKTTDTLDTTSLLWNMNIDDGSLLTAGSTSVGMVKYNGTTATAGNFDGGTTTPTGATRLNYGGYFYPTYLNLVGSVDTTTASSHVFVETGTDGFVRPKTLANFKTEIFASPTLVTPNIGVATGTSFNSITGLSATTPLMNGTAAVGTSVTVARADHVHPIDTSRAPLVSPAFTGTPTVNGVAFSGYSGFKNYIINGNFDIWQRGTVQESSVDSLDGYGSDDRWVNQYFVTYRKHTRQLTTDIEKALFNSAYFSRTEIVTAGTSSSLVIKKQHIEDVTRLAGKTVTLSFWAKADSNKNIAMEVAQGFGTGGSPSAFLDKQNVTKIALTPTWQKKIITFTIPSIAGKTIGTDGVHTSYTQIRLWFDAGTNFSLNTNSLGNQSGTFDIAQVQLEEGSVATPFEQRPYGLELSLCQRYYESGTNSFCANGGGISSAMTDVKIGSDFKVQKRISPTITYATISSTINSIPADVNGLVVQYSSGNSNNFGVNWTASAEL